MNKLWLGDLKRILTVNWDIQNSHHFMIATISLNKINDPCSLWCRWDAKDHSNCWRNHCHQIVDLTFAPDCLCLATEEMTEEKERWLIKDKGTHAFKSSSWKWVRLAGIPNPSSRKTLADPTLFLSQDSRNAKAAALSHTAFSHNSPWTNLLLNSDLLITF
jgi:hypothetical protein